MIIIIIIIIIIVIIIIIIKLNRGHSCIDMTEVLVLHIRG